MVIRDVAPLIYGPVSFEGLITDHDEYGGSKRGKILFSDGILRDNLAHMGDYGEAELTEEQCHFLEQADI